ncbi:hypothetical protein Taro_024400 [Colocasia esculenta]|uniref:Uncharacterized protein n=1 Tax=Colocasia esculenta TaxID=4460 RepID=A0A843V7B3_COLES|nr:hypothetical protein [Colocasia esculenta]
MDSLRKSFKSHGSYKHSNSSRGPSIDFDRQEQQPILFDTGEASSDDADHRRDVVVQIDGNSRQFEDSKGPGICTGPSYQFWRDDLGAGRGGSEGSSDAGRGSRGFSFPPQQTARPTSSQMPVADIGEDPPSPFTSAFIQKEKALGCEVSSDVDTEEPKKSATRTPSPTAKELRVSFQEPSADGPAVPPLRRPIPMTATDRRTPGLRL